jgi:hypothetical protein
MLSVALDQRAKEQQPKDGGQQGINWRILNLVFHSFPSIFSHQWKFLCCFQTCQRAPMEAFPKNQDLSRIRIDLT